MGGGGEIVGYRGLGNSRDVNDMWDRTSSGIKEVAREVLGVSRNNDGGH